MNSIPIILLCLISFFAGAYFHEKDMERNFLLTGNTHAWFSNIGYEDNKK